MQVPEAQLHLERGVARLIPWKDERGIKSSISTVLCLNITVQQKLELVCVDAKNRGSALAPLVLP